MYVHLGDAANSVQHCANDVNTISTDLQTLKSDVDDIKEFNDDVKSISTKLNSILTKMKDTGVTEIIGKIPKIGMVIEMGLQLTEEVSSVVKTISTRTGKVLEKISKVVDTFEEVFTELDKNTQTAADGLQTAHEVVKAAHDCGLPDHEATEPKAFEKAMKELFSGGAKQALTTTKDAGDMCTHALDPYEEMKQKLADAANKIIDAITPAQDFLKLVEAFVNYLSDKIDEMSQVFNNGGSKCLKQLYDFGGGKAIDLIKCPVDEAAVLFFEEVAEPLEQALAGLVSKIGFEVSVSSAVFSIEKIEIPTASQLLPNLQDLGLSDFATCTWKKISKSEYENQRQEVLDVTPLTIKAPDIESFDLISITAPEINYESACEAAWNKLKEENSMDECKRLFQQGVDGDCYLPLTNYYCFSCKKCCSNSYIPTFNPIPFLSTGLCL